MTIRRRVEEIDEDGRHSIMIKEEPMMTRASNDEMVTEEQVTRSGGWNLARGFVRTFGLWVLAALAIVETLLGFRLGFLLAGANPANGFVDFIYDVSGPLADPMVTVLIILLLLILLFGRPGHARGQGLSVRPSHCHSGEHPERRLLWPRTVVLTV